MKANIYIQYQDGSEVFFEYNCDDEESQSIDTLLMVCRGVQMASMANKVITYDDEGHVYYSYIK